MGRFKIKFNEKLDNTRIFGVYSGKVLLPNRDRCNKGDRPFDRLFYVVKGTICLYPDKHKIIKGKKGNILFLPNDVTYTSEWIGNEDGEYISINFLLNNPSLIFPNEIILADKDTTGIFYKFFTDIHTTWINGNLGYKLAMLVELYQILHMLYLNSTKRMILENNDEIHQGILYIENHYLEDIDISFLAKKCNISETKFRKLFKEYKKYPPITYRNYLRIKKAKELLRSREYTITEAAISVNIPDLCYFNRLYKQFMGISPSAFVKQLSNTYRK